ncbi:hypothetical protein ASC94_07310 [Massilia sp. Root418]|uniref:DUF1800 domain-containing protein n=1 Tax=Massilia sp. Root418 TaxID=1736532 RepID=UPI0006FFB01C|nr:DUF1800 domain-containing protein [Massilia sp. Root418]KQW96638.1 hypothetical protein ASC94_07310 [Massilia sp. Root418]
MRAARWCAPMILAAAALAAQAEPLSGPAAAVHVLNRLAYGPAPGDIERVTQMGVARYIDSQLYPEALELPAALNERLAALDTVQRSSGEVLGDFLAVRDMVKDETDGAKAMRREVLGRIATQAAEARIARAVASPRQLEEVMVDFWFNHFNVFSGKGQVKPLVASYERDAIRPYVFGSFRDMLGATAKHPAMLYYLDNYVSKAGGLNENYARELMELHTLGVDKGYTQKDVTELARMLTGWTFAPRQLVARNETFRFDPKRHDNGEKQWLGRAVKPQGQAEGEYALDVLAVHPATARHVSYKLAQYFVADQPPPALVERMAQTWIASRGDIRSVLKTLFASEEFMAPEAQGAKFKTPYQFVISAARAAQAGTGGAAGTAGMAAAPLAEVKPVMGVLDRLGMPLYGCQTPDGYKNTQAAWLNPDALSRRIGYAATLAQGVDVAVVQAALGESVSPRTQGIVASSPQKLRTAMLLGSPDFMQR